MVVLVFTVAVLVLPRAAAAQSKPVNANIGVLFVYDDNIFLQPAGTGDFVVRFTPELSAQRQTSRTALSASARLDAERFRDHGDLSTFRAREHGAIALTAQASSTMKLQVRGEYTGSSNASELNRTTGLALERTPGSEWLAASEARWRLRARTQLKTAYDFQHLGSSRHRGTDSHAVSVSVDHRLSNRLRTAGRFQGGRYLLDADDVLTSHAMTMGLTRTLSPTFTVSAEAGPRCTQGSFRPELSVRADLTPPRREFSLSYARTLGTAIGIRDLIDVQRGHMIAAYRSPNGRSASIAAAVYLNQMGGQTTRVYQLSASIARPITRGVMLAGEYSRALQNGESVTLAENLRIRRNLVALQIVAGSGIKK